MKRDRERFGVTFPTNRFYPRGGDIIRECFKSSEASVHRDICPLSHLLPLGECQDVLGTMNALTVHTFPRALGHVCEPVYETRVHA